MNHIATDSWLQMALTPLETSKETQDTATECGAEEDPNQRNGSYDFAEGEDLRRLERLLNAAHELMKEQPGLDQSAFEHLRRLRVKVRLALSNLEVVPRDTLPRKAPALWECRAERGESPVEFIMREYAPWLHKGISRADIRRLDKKLYEAIYAWRITGAQLDKIGLPTKKGLIDQKLQTASTLKRPTRSVRLSELPADERESARLWNVARRRRQRAPKS